MKKDLDVRTVFVRSPYNYSRDLASFNDAIKCLDPSRAVQSQKEESDINTIVRRFGLTGQLPDNIRMPQYGDFTGVQSYQDCLNAVIQADKAFMALPAHVRERFNNSAEKFVEFCLDDNNRDEAEKLGLVPKKALPEKGAVPATVPGVNPGSLPDPGKAPAH